MRARGDFRSFRPLRTVRRRWRCSCSPLRRSGAAAADGAWKERSQLVWDAAAGKLVRQTLRAWDPHPELGLDFLWETAGAAPTPGAINGSGRLLWLAKGAAAYDRDAIFSEYEGDVRDGRPDGNGSIKLKSGLTYDGTWRDGIMIGYGVLRFENGDRYAGAVDDGAPDGFGRYASVDGTIFEGTFRAGKRDGVRHAHHPRRPSFPFGMAGRRGSRPVTPLDDTPAVMAQSGGVTVSTYIDTKLNNEFIDADVDMLSYAYTATPSAGEVFVTPRCAADPRHLEGRRSASRRRDRPDARGCSRIRASSLRYSW